MAKTRKEGVPAEQQTVQESPVSSAEKPRFSVATLRASARKLFGVSISTYDAATYKLTGEYTVDAMREHINKWLKEGY